MQVTKEKRGECAILAVHGRLDGTTSPNFENEIVAWMGAGGKAFVLDLAGISFLSSAALRVLLSMAKRAGRMGGHVVLASPSAVVSEVFEISNFTSIFTVCPSLEEAVTAVQGLVLSSSAVASPEIKTESSALRSAPRESSLPAPPIPSPAAVPSVIQAAPKTPSEAPAPNPLLQKSPSPSETPAAPPTPIAPAVTPLVPTDLPAAEPPPSAQKSSSAPIPVLPNLEKPVASNPPISPLEKKETPVAASAIPAPVSPPENPAPKPKAPPILGPANLEIVVGSTVLLCRDGDVLGCEGTIQKHLFRALEARHALIGKNGHEWFLLIPRNVQIATQLDGKSLAPGVRQPLTGEHELSTESFSGTFRLTALENSVRRISPISRLLQWLTGRRLS